MCAELGTLKNTTYTLQNVNLSSATSVLSHTGHVTEILPTVINVKQQWNKHKKFILNNNVPEGERNFKQKEEYEISKKKYDDIVRKQEQLLRGEYKY